MKFLGTRILLWYELRVICRLLGQSCSALQMQRRRKFPRICCSVWRDQPLRIFPGWAELRCGFVAFWSFTLNPKWASLQTQNDGQVDLELCRIADNLFMLLDAKWLPYYWREFGWICNILFQWKWSFVLGWPDNRYDTLLLPGCPGGYQCQSSGGCVTADQLCDGDNNCGAYEDEMYCDGESHSILSHHLDRPQYTDGCRPICARLLTRLCPHKCVSLTALH